MEDNREAYLPVKEVLVLPPAKDLVESVQNQMIEGEADALKVQIFFKKMAKLSELVFKGEKGKEIKDIVFEQTKQYQEGKTSRVFGSKIIEQNRRYTDYSECNDPILEKLTEIEARVKELKKQREAELDLLMPSKGELGIIETANIAVNYYPELIEHPNTDLAEVNLPKKGSKTLLVFHV